MFCLDTPVLEQSDRGFGWIPGFSPMLFGGSENRGGQANAFALGQTT
jgi:hypothetical protein